MAQHNAYMVMLKDNASAKSLLKKNVAAKGLIDTNFSGYLLHLILISLALSPNGIDKNDINAQDSALLRALMCQVWI